jgi:nucleoside-diphosphate-sugar epimerase
MLVAVTGASGWIGGQVVEQLRLKEIGVRRLVRCALKPGDYAFDLTRPSDEWTNLLEGCDVIIHCAARVHVSEEQRRGSEADFSLSNSNATKELVRYASAAGVKRFVFASTIGVYDWTEHRPMMEDDLVGPESAYSRSKVEAENWIKDSNLDWRICRLATVFGTGDSANFARLAKAIKRGRFLIPGKGSARKSVIPIDLAAAVLVRAALEPNWSRMLVNVALPIAPSLQEVCDAFSDECALPRARKLPLSIITTAAILGTLVGKLGFRSPLTYITLKKLTTDSVVVTNLLSDFYPSQQWPTFAEALRAHRIFYGKL